MDPHAFAQFRENPGAFAQWLHDLSSKGLQAEALGLFYTFIMRQPAGPWLFEVSVRAGEISRAKFSGNPRCWLRERWLTLTADQSRGFFLTDPVLV